MPSTVISGIDGVSQAWYPYSRHTFYAAGRHWVFYINDSFYAAYKTSIDGASWSAETTINQAGSGDDFCIFFDGIYVHYARHWNYIVYYRRGTPQSDGTIFWSAIEQTVFSGSSSNDFNALSISVDSTGHALIGSPKWNGVATRPWVFRNANTNGTWADTPEFPYMLSVTLQDSWRVIPVPLTSSRFYCVYVVYGGTAYGKLYDAGWGSEESDVCDYDIYHSGGISAVADGDDVHFVYLRKTTYQIRYNKRTWGAGWAANDELVQDSLLVDCFPALSVYNSEFVCFWNSCPTQDHVYYKKRTSGVWDAAPTDWITDSQLHTWRRYCTSSYDGSRIGFLYLTGPFVGALNIRYDWVGLKDASTSLKAGFIVLQGSASLSGFFLSRHSVSLNLKSGFESQGVQFLLGKLIIRHSTTKSLEGYLAVRHSATLNLKTGFNSQDIESLKTKLIIRHSSSNALKSGFVTQFRDLEELFGKFIARHSDFQDLPQKLVVRHSDVRNQKGRFVVRHSGFADLQGHFYVQHWRDLKSCFIVRHSVFYDYRMNMKCGFLVPQTSRNLKNKFRIRHSTTRNLKSGLFIGSHTVQNLKAGFNAGWAPLSVDLKAGFTIPPTIYSQCEIIIREDDFVNWINYFEFIGTGFLSGIIIENDASVKVTGTDSGKITIGTQSKGSKEITFGWNWDDYTNFMIDDRFSLREHETWAGWNPDVYFSKVHGPSILTMTEIGRYGAAYIFIVCNRRWLRNKRIRFRWEGQTGYADWPSYVEIWDGAYLRSSDTDFPVGSQKVTKGDGLLQTISSKLGSFAEETVDVQANFASAEDFVTIFFRFRDDWWDKSGLIKLFWFEINEGPGGTGNIIRDDFDNPVVLERSGTWNDYGYVMRS